MRVGIFGTGDVGRALGRGFISRGHEVKMGSRDPKNPKAAEWADEMGVKASTGTFADAATFGEVIALATLWSGTKNAIDMAPAASFQGKIVIDATNPLRFEEGKPPGLALGYTDSAGEQVQRWLPQSRVVKAFNIVGNAHMVDPSFPGGPPDMFICGDDAGAKKAVSSICESFGWPVNDIGGIEGARLLEPLAMLWIRWAILSGSANHAFKLLHK